MNFEYLGMWKIIRCQLGVTLGILSLIRLPKITKKKNNQLFTNSVYNIDVSGRKCQLLY